MARSLDLAIPCLALFYSYVAGRAIGISQQQHRSLPAWNGRRWIGTGLGYVCSLLSCFSPQPHDFRQPLVFRHVRGLVFLLTAALQLHQPLALPRHYSTVTARRAQARLGCNNPSALWAVWRNCFRSEARILGGCSARPLCSDCPPSPQLWTAHTTTWAAHRLGG